MHRKIFSLIFLTVPFLSAMSQGPGFEELLDSGKAEYKRQYEAYASDYSKAYFLLEKAVQKNPSSAEARYWFAHAIDRVNTYDACNTDQTSSHLTRFASQQLEKVVSLQKRYTGETFILDPYSKLTSLWGSQALSFKRRGQQDSVLWAYKEGKKRGGFIEGMLEYNRQLLGSCDTNAILFTQGDNATFPILYLQAIEKIRTDITVVDVNMCGCKWYTEHLRGSTLRFTYDDPLLDSAGYREWEAREEVIVNPENPKESIRWNFKPTYYGSYVLKSDLVLLNIYRENFFRRPFYYSGTFVDSASGSLHLDDANYIVVRGIVSRVKSIPNVKDTPVVIVPDALHRYHLNNLPSTDIENSPDVLNHFTMMRLAFMTYVDLLLEKEKWERARELWKEMGERLPVAKLPIHEAITPYYNKMADAVREGRKME